MLFYYIIFSSYWGTDLSQIVVKKYSVILIKNIDELLNPPTDLIKLIQVDRPGILLTLKSRFMNDFIYTRFQIQYLMLLCTKLSVLDQY